VFVILGIPSYVNRFVSGNVKVICDLFPLSLCVERNLRQKLLQSKTHFAPIHTHTHTYASERSTSRNKIAIAEERK
jgi:hypothetical protein